MARPESKKKSTKRPAKKRQTAKGRAGTKRKVRRFARVSLVRVFIVLALLTMLAATLGAVGYVIFFRTVLAAEVTGAAASHRMIFEEPDIPLRVPHDEGEAGQRQWPRPRMAIVIDDMGYLAKSGDELLHLPYALSFSFLPHAPYTHSLVEEAHRIGRTVLLHLPLQPRDPHWNPGPGTIRVDDVPAVRSRLFAADLAAVPHAVGVNNHMGSLYTENSAAMRGLLRLVKARHLFFIDSATSPRSVGLATARQMHLPSARRRVFLDNVKEPASICAQLQTLVRYAERRGAAIGIGHPHPATVSALRKCLPEYRHRVRLVSVATLVH